MSQPTPDNASALPIEPVLPPLAAALAAGLAVLSAPTGSGKTSRAPLALLDAAWLAGQRILMLEPRRPAARMAAARALTARVGEGLTAWTRLESLVFIVLDYPFKYALPFD